MILVRAAINLGHTGDSKARASGYTHTYFDSEDIDLAALSAFPNDNEFGELAKRAWDEADSLWTALGAPPADFMRSTPSAPRLASINSWFTPGQDPVLDASSISSQSDLDDGFQPEDDDENSDNNSDAARLQALIDEEEQAHSRSNQVDDRMLELTTAAIAVEIDETNLA